MEGKVCNTDDHEIFFKPKEYLKEVFKLLENGSKEFHIQTFFLKQRHQFWNSLDKHDLTMLEFGGGPCIHLLISASPFVREIVFAEFTEPNRQEVQAWLTNKTSACDWSPFFKYVVQDLEGKTEEEAVTRERELRRQISHVIPCDIRQSDPLNEVENCIIVQKKFDIVSSTACLEAAVSTEDDYCEAVRKLARLLNPGGRLIMAGYLQSSVYTVGSSKFQDFPLNESLIRQGFNEAGFGKVHFVPSTEGTAKEKQNSDLSGYFVAWGVLQNHND